MIQSIDDLTLAGKRALVRVDFNVPLDDAGNITDDTRIKAAIPTIEKLISKGASVVLMSHLGRPKGKRTEKESLAVCAKRLSELLGREVVMENDCIGVDTKGLAPGQVVLLENLRFHAAEEKPELDPNFAKELSENGDVYINDAFGTAHRAHSSTTTIVQYFPGNAAVGLLMEKELEFLGKHFSNPKRPFYAIVGGAKVSTKLKVLRSLLNTVDAIFIGGGMTYTFWKADGHEVGNSLCEEELIPDAKKFLSEAKEKGKRVLLPHDAVIANDFSPDAEKDVVTMESGIPDGWQAMDIGPLSLSEMKKELTGANEIFWNGPLGVFEFPRFAVGTETIAKSLSELDATTIIGGGDSVAAVNQLGLAQKMTHISTGGGACLEFIENGTLPGIEALSRKP